MRVSRRHLRRLIREACGDAPVEEVSVDLPPVEHAVATELVVESETPEHDMLVEMEIASRSLAQVVESVQNAAQLCHNCGGGVIEQAPIVEAMATQAEALQEMLDAQVAVIQENANARDEFSFTGDVNVLPGDEAFGIGYEAGSLGLE